MNEQVLFQAAAWLDQGLPVALATIVRIKGSSSQPLGSRMAITHDNRFEGAVSGGCVETDVYTAAMDVLRSGQALMLHYRQVEDPLIEIGLNCNGQIDVLVEPLDSSLYALLSVSERCVSVTLCAPGMPTAPAPVHGQVWPNGRSTSDLPPALVQDALAALCGPRPAAVTYPDGRVALFEPLGNEPVLVIFGGTAAAVPLVRFAQILGFRTVVTDARPAYATREKHPEADEVVPGWPQDVIDQIGIDDRTYVVSLNHEPRFEDAMLRALAGRPIRYLGAIGQRARQTERVERLTQAGFDFSQLPPIHTPIGLDIGGKSPEEMALSVIAEIVAVRNGHSGGMLFENTRHEPGRENPHDA